MDELAKALAALADLQKKFDGAQTELEKFRTDSKAQAEGKVAKLQKDFDEAAAKRDAAEATVKRLQDEAAKAPKLDELVTRKLAIIDSARTLHVKAADVDVSKSEREIMVAALVARIPEFKADGKSDDYIRARFDVACEEQKKADASMSGINAASAQGGAGATRVEFVTDDAARMVREYDGAVVGQQAFTMALWKGKESAEKAREDAKKTIMDGRRVSGTVMPIFDGKEMMDRAIAWIRNYVPRATLDMFSRMENLRRDSDPATAFFSRQLLYVMTTPYQYDYPESKYPTLFPVTYEVPTGARTWAAHLFDQRGQAQIVDDYADDAPNAEVVGGEQIGKIYPVRSEYSFSLQDIRSAMMANMPLEALKAKAARDFIERKCDSLACTGDSTRSMTGAANDANASTVTASTKAAGATQWIISGALNATPNEILNDVNLLYNKILSATDGVNEMDALYVGKNAWGVLNTLRLDNYNQTSVGDYLRTKLAWLKRIEYWPRLNSAGSGSVERIMGAKIGPEFCRFVIPQEFEQLPPQPINMAWKTPCHKRWGEPQVMKPKTLAYMDNTSS